MAYKMEADAGISRAAAEQRRKQIEAERAAAAARAAEAARSSAPSVTRPAGASAPTASSAASNREQRMADLVARGVLPPSAINPGTTPTSGATVPTADPKAPAVAAPAAAALPKAPTFGPAPTFKPFEAGAYQQSDRTNALYERYMNAIGMQPPAYDAKPIQLGGPYAPSAQTEQYRADMERLKGNRPGDYSSQFQPQIDALYEQLLGRGKFSYDMNADSLYQQYKDRYTQQANMGMMDSMGQAAALTGGYGNSYAQSVGQQTYDRTMQALNDLVPQLEERAYTRWQGEGQDLARNLGIAQSMDDTAYGRYRDQVGDWRQDYADAANLYSNERAFDYNQYADQRNFDYGAQVDQRNFDYGQYRDSMSDYFNQAQMAGQDYRDERAFDYGKFADQRAFDYGKYADQRSFDYGQYADERAFQQNQYTDERDFQYQQQQNELNRSDALKSAEEKKSFDMSMMLLQRGQMPDDATLANAGINPNDAKKFVSMMTSGVAVGGGGSGGGGGGGTSKKTTQTKWSPDAAMGLMQAMENGTFNEWSAEQQLLGYTEEQTFLARKTYESAMGVKETPAYDNYKQQTIAPVQEFVKGATSFIQDPFGSVKKWLGI